MFKKEKNGKTNIKSFKKKVTILVFLFAFLFILLIIYFSKLQIQIINFNFSSVTRRHLNKDYKIIIKWYILGKLPIFKFNITKVKLDRLKIREKIKDIDLKMLQDKNKIDTRLFKSLKKTNINIKNINLNLEIGTENAALTSIIVPVISTVIAVILQKKVEKYDNQIFIINPKYLNKNLLNISLSGIFELKINHIINMICILNKKEGVNRHERTSDRRSYDYSYE